MVIYRSQHGSFYFGQKKENGWFHFSNRCPDIDTLDLNPCMFGNEEEKYAWENGINVPKEKEAKFNTIFSKKNNYKDICDFIKSFYEVNQEELDKEFDYHPDIIKLTKSIISENKRYNREIDDYCFEQIYWKIKSYIHSWGKDVKRIKTYVKEHRDIENIMFPDMTMVDVFNEPNPAKSGLLYEFYRDWGDTLDKYIDEAVELYPDADDFDKRFYYVKEKLGKV